LLIAHCLLAATLSACGSDDGGGAAGGGISVSERTWVDDSRDLPRTPRRALRVLFWAPNRREPLPLLVMAHGFGGLPEKFDAFAHAVAAAGYLVAAPAFPLTNQNAPGGHQQGLPDYLNQPGDVSFVISQILTANETTSDALFGRIDADRIALLGHSLGGLTALAATRKDCCRDPRIDAVVAVAPLVALFLTQFGPDAIGAGPPTLLLHGQQDLQIGFDSSVDLYAQIEAPKVLVGLPDTGHSELLESQSEPPVASRRTAQAATIAFLDAVFSGNDDPLTEMLDDLTVAGNLIESEL
jgi:predicted dienelactone hydrolase